MFARKVYVRLKPNALREFARLMDKKILPWLRSQEGFVDSIVLAAPDGLEIQVLSFWNQDAFPESHQAIGYPNDVLNLLEGLLDEITHGRTFEVLGSTRQGLRPNGQGLPNGSDSTSNSVRIASAT